MNEIHLTKPGYEYVLKGERGIEREREREREIKRSIEREGEREGERVCVYTVPLTVEVHEGLYETHGVEDVCVVVEGASAVGTTVIIHNYNLRWYLYNMFFFHRRPLILRRPSQHW